MSISSSLNSIPLFVFLIYVLLLIYTLLSIISFHVQASFIGMFNNPKNVNYKRNLYNSNALNYSRVEDLLEIRITVRLDCKLISALLIYVWQVDRACSLYRTIVRRLSTVFQEFRTTFSILSCLSVRA